MKEIQLTKGKVALVDDEDFEYLNQWKWCASKNGVGFCAVRSIIIDGKRTTRPIHQFIMGSALINHIDGDELNCQKYNMRKCTKHQNNLNKRPHRNSSSKFKGVFWSKYGNNFRWRVRIMYNRKTHNLGYFEDEIEAAKVYDQKARELFGEFAWLNFNSKSA